jgi:hypothetical protein
MEAAWSDVFPSASATVRMLAEERVLKNISKKVVCASFFMASDTSGIAESALT